MKHLGIKILRSSDGKRHYKAVMTRRSLYNVQFSRSIYPSLSEITTILFKNFNNVLTKSTIITFFCFVTLTRILDLVVFFASPPPLPHLYSLSFPGKVLDHVISIDFSPLSPLPHLLPLFFGEST